MVEKIDYGKLLFVYGFIKCWKPSILFDNIRKGKIKLAEDFGFQSRSKINYLMQKSRRNAFIIDKIIILFNAQKNDLKLYNDNTELMSERKSRSLQGKGIKILRPKRILKRLLIALAQVKVGYLSEKCLNKIRKIIYPLYWAKEITKECIWQ